MKIGRLLSSLRHQHDLTLIEVANATGVSKQHIHNIECGRANPSTTVLRNLIIFLSQYVPHSYASDQPLRRCDPEIVLKLLLTVFDIQELQERYSILDTIDAETDPVTAILRTSSTPQDGIDVWTVTQIMGEAVSHNQAKETFTHITQSNVRYSYFVPLSDNTRWREGVHNLKRQATTPLEKQQIRDGVKIFGISDVAFFSSFRIYDPQSSGAVGTYNIGGTKLSEVKLAPMNAKTIEGNVSVLQYIISADNANMLADVKEFYIKEIHSYVSRKM